jgi:hypothetical protein
MGMWFGLMALYLRALRCVLWELGGGMLGRREIWGGGDGELSARLWREQGRSFEC